MSNILTDSSYEVSKEYEQPPLSKNQFETPFVDQSSYLQRANNKNFKKSALPYEGTGWYEHRAVNNVDLDSELRQLGDDQIIPFPTSQSSESYKSNIPRSSKQKSVNSSKEGYITHPFDYDYQGAEDVWSSGLIRDSIESFKNPFQDNNSTIIIVIIIILLLIAVYYFNFTQQGKSTMETLCNKVRAHTLGGYYYY